MADVTTVRLRNAVTGVVVEVDESKVERLGHGWKPATRATKRAGAKKAEAEPEADAEPEPEQSEK